MNNAAETTPGKRSSKSNRKPLGRGLAALIPDDLVAEESSPRPSGVRRVPIGEIHPNPEQPRREFDPKALADLAGSIEAHGILSPLVVRAEGQGGGYVLIAGERRLRAAGIAGLKEVPVLVHEGAEDPVVQLELALVENLQREDLNPVESAEGYQRLVKEYGHTQAQVSKRVGKDRATVANAIRLLKLPKKVLDLVREGRLSAGHGRALVSVEDPERLRRIVAQVLAGNLSVRATERLVAEKASKTANRSAQPKQEKVLEYAAGLLTRALGTQVNIRGQAKGAGRIVIDYHNAEELERLIHALRGDAA
ncbi:MAG: ParB/RepB/Spo0J family partition protein [Myxococcota bacterium]|nr:ParB/RepB/Spo0J family partition protein [Myxococcota bacterium]